MQRKPAAGMQCIWRWMDRGLLLALPLVHPPLDAPRAYRWLALRARVCSSSDSCRCCVVSNFLCCGVNAIGPNLFARIPDQATPRAPLSNIAVIDVSSCFEGGCQKFESCQIGWYTVLDTQSRQKNFIGLFSFKNHKKHNFKFSKI